jgi:hypothetical protein
VEAYRVDPAIADTWMSGTFHSEGEDER